jgi:hypothetical protein
MVGLCLSRLPYANRGAGPQWYLEQRIWLETAGNGITISGICGNGGMGVFQ